MESPYSNDRPVQPNGVDLLKRRDFASRLADALFEYSDPESLTIGLFGGWGSGKSSILSFLKKRLDTYPEGFNAPIVMDFNPWRVVSRDQLFQEFFKALTSALDQIDEPNLRQRWLGKLSSLGSNLDPLDGVKLSELVAKYAALSLAVTPIVASGIAIADAAVNAAAKTFVNAARAENTIEKLKTAIDKRLCSIDRRIVVLIDDIDRLHSGEVRLMLQLVKAVADFDKLVYILALDWETAAEKNTNVFHPISLNQSVILSRSKGGLPATRRP